jgi:MFS family permease
MATGLMVSGILGPIAGGIAADLSQHGGGPRRTLWVLSALALITAPAALFGLMPGTASATGLLVTFMATACAVLVMGTALFTIVVPNELRGFCMATFTSATLVIGVGLGPVGVSYLSGAIGGPTTIGSALSIVGASAGVIAAGVFAMGGRHFQVQRGSELPRTPSLNA